jgi:alpha-L-fucosidase
MKIQSSAVMKVLAMIIATGLLGSLASSQAFAAQTVPPRAPLDVPPTAHGVQVDLSSFVNNDGIATRDDPSNGNLDGSGFSYPAEHLPASGIVKIGGMTFSFPGSGKNEKNNIGAEGQRIDVPAGQYVATSMLVTSTYGATSGEFTFHYDDGTRQTSRFDVADWYTAGFGIWTMPFRYTPTGGRDEHPVYLSALRMGLNNRRNLVAITLPRAPEGQRRLHLFALTLHPIVPGIHVEFFDLLEGPKITTEEAGHHTVHLNVHNLGTSWISELHRMRIVIEAPGVKTISPVSVDLLAPGEVFKAEVHLATQLPRGTEVTGEAKVTGRFGIRESVPIKLSLGAPDYSSTDGSLHKHPSASWYENAKFGIFIHWGIYSVPAWAPVGGIFAEWYWAAMNDPTFETHTYHRQTYGTGFSYDDFIPQFQPSRFDPREWVELIKASGARYFVFTAKHHDGFAMYDSSTTDRDSVALGPRRDYLRELFRAAETHAPELKRGVYYSLFEWYHPAITGSLPRNPYTQQPVPYTGAKPVADYVVNHVLPQMRELIDGYDPDTIWCDFEASRGADYWKTADIAAHYYNQAKNRAQPKEVAINDRCSVTNPERSPYAADYVTIEYDTFRTTYQKKWEMTRGLDPHSFGFNSQTPENQYLTANGAIDLLADVVSKNGNFLLNIGPAGDGSIPSVMRNSLLEIGNWLATNGEAIYGTDYWWRTSEEGNLRFTLKGNEAFYVIALEWPGTQLVIDSPIPIRKDFSVQLLGDGNRQLEWAQQAGSVIINLPPDAESASRHAWVFRIRPPVPGGR